MWESGWTGAVWEAIKVRCGQGRCGRGRGVKTWAGAQALWVWASPGPLTTLCVVLRRRCRLWQVGSRNSEKLEGACSAAAQYVSRQAAFVWQVISGRGGSQGDSG